MRLKRLDCQISTPSILTCDLQTVRPHSNGCMGGQLERIRKFDQLSGRLVHKQRSQIYPEDPKDLGNSILHLRALQNCEVSWLPLITSTG